MNRKFWFTTAGTFIHLQLWIKPGLKKLLKKEKVRKKTSFLLQIVVFKLNVNSLRLRERKKKL